MATITPRKRRDGSIAYKAEVRVKRSGLPVYQKTQTFDRHAHAKAWAQDLEAELREPGRLAQMAHRGISLKDLVKLYLEEYSDQFGRTKNADLAALKNAELGELNALEISAKDVIDHIRGRRETVAPSTALNDIIWLRTLWRYGRSAKEIPLDAMVIEDASAFCWTERLVAKPKQRDRRPTPDELERLDAHFENRKGWTDYPMQDLMWFAVHSARRQSEICRLQWSDNREDEHTGLVRDAKHPKLKEGNHRRFKYTKEAWEIVQRQPRGEDPRIFPYDPKTVGTYFRNACNILEIKDLRFHDLRHEATSRLFEAGYPIVEVQQFTLHENWNTLKRYTHLRPGEVQHR